MSHCLILGMTESGKTTLAKRLAANYKQNGVPVIVLDSLNDPEWQADFQTTNPDEFLQTFWQSQRCACFIDEAGDAVGKYNTVMQRTATRGRHWGHAVHFITQRGVQLAPTVRDQCSHIFLLCTSLQDSKVHANEWNAPILASANSLRKGEYFHATRFGEVSKHNLFGLTSGTGAPKNGIDIHTDDRRGTPETDAGTAPESKNGSAAERSRFRSAGADPRPEAGEPDPRSGPHTPAGGLTQLPT